MTSSRHTFAWPLAVATAWLLTWKHLAVEWQFNEQYQFGWAVPALCLYTAWNRWPGPLFPPSRPLFSNGLAALSFLILALGEFLHRQDPVWHLTATLLTLGSTLLTTAWLHRIGGTPLLKRLAWPVLLAWVAVPWPSPVEQFVTQHLLHTVTTVSVDLLNFIQIPALAHGNVIELRNGLVGIDEACSGIRSFQASIMASLFLGELLQLGTRRRLFLLGGAILLCLAGNESRVLALTILLHANGPSAFHWHDTAGILASIFQFGAIGFLALLLKSQVPSAPAARLPLPQGKPSDWIAPALLVPLPLLVALFCAWISAPVAPLPTGPRWQVDVKDLPSGWSARPTKVPETALTMLRFSQSDSQLLQTAQGWSAHIVHLYWENRSRIPAAAFTHNPGICLASQGWLESLPSESWKLQLHGRSLACVTYRLRQGDATLAVVQILNTAGGSEFPASYFYSSTDWLERLRGSWSAPQHQVTEEVLLTLPDFGDSDSIRKAATGVLETILRPTP